MLSELCLEKELCVSNIYIYMGDLNGHVVRHID